MIGEIQMYRNSIRNIFNTITNAPIDQEAQWNTGVHPTPLGLNNANGFNGLIQTIPDDGDDHHVQLNTGLVAGVDNLNHNLGQNNGGASEENMDCPKELTNEEVTISIP